MQAATSPPIRPPSVLIETHGCKLNTADSQALAQRFLSAGCTIAAPGDSADVYILNTCTVTHVADRKARQVLSGARRRHPGALVVATGCYVERDADAVAALSGVDMVVTNRRKEALVDNVVRRLGTALTPCADGAAGPVERRLLGRSRASVKIQEGCDQVCAYCIVPRVRGRERSIPVQSLVRQVGELASLGCAEVVLTGTQLGAYGFDLAGENLASMIRRLLAETGIRRLRVSSLQPLEITPELLSLWSAEGRGRLCPHFHVPLQSGSDRVLRRMRRRYTAPDFMRALSRVREAVRDASLTTDIIAGFPGEFEDDHRATLHLVREAAFADVHVFPYSPRPGTTAAHLDSALPPEIRARRAGEIRAAAGISFVTHRRRFIGAVRPVLWEGEPAETGLTDNYFRVRLDRSGSTPRAPIAGEIRDARLVALNGDLMAARLT